MIVFKTVLKIMNKLKGTFILYTVILLAMTVLMQSSNQVNVSFTDSKPDIYIVNNDGQQLLTQDFMKYLKKHTNVKDIKNTSEAIDDAIFYRDIHYVVYIPEHFSQDILDGKTPTVSYKSSGDYDASYTQMLVEKYLKVACVYKDDFSNQELCKEIDQVVNQDITVDFQTSLNTSRLNSAAFYFNFLNYSFLAGCVYCIVMLLASIKEKNVSKRTIVSSFSYNKYNRIVLLSCFIVIILMWLLYMGLSFMMFSDVMVTSNGVAFMVNSFVYILCTLLVGFMIGTITNNKRSIGAIINVIALGTSFLCGCFVQIDFLPDYVVNLAHILPSYYYVANNNLIKGIEVFDSTHIQPLLVNGGIILAFGFIFLLITSYVSKRKIKE